MIEFYIINLDKASNFKYYDVKSIICREEEIEGEFHYSFRYSKVYIKKHITKNFAALAFKNVVDHSIYSTNTKNRVPIKEWIDTSEDIDLHNSIRKV